MELQIESGIIWDTEKPLIEQSTEMQALISQVQSGVPFNRTYESCTGGKRRALTKTYVLSELYNLTVIYIYNEPPDSNEFMGLKEFKYTVTNG